MGDGIVGVLTGNLNSLIQKEIGSLVGIDNDVRKLSSTLTTILAVLEDAETKKFHNKPLENWLAKLKAAAFEAADLLEEWSNNAQQATYNNEVVYGRGDDKENIIKILLNSVRSGEALSVLPVIGMGGIGKTTLAQWVYNDHRVISHFDERAWVCVSDNFEVKSISVLKMMLDGKACKLETLENVQRKLVSGNKFLLVMDDVWNEVQQKSTNLKSVLKCVPFHSILLLNMSIGGRELAFVQGQGREEVVNLVEIGKEIVKKCVGIPLARKSLGGLMWLKRRVVEWEQVRDSKIWELREEEASGILPALRLSYKHLPSHLKQCFAICSIYPKDFELDREQLIYLWMANGYLQSDGTMELEAFGMLIFHELVCRSFFQGCKMEIEFGIETGVTCKMNDLMHDLASLVSVNELSVVEIGRGNGVVKCTRHMSLVLDSRTTAESSNHLSLAKSKSMLRTLIVLSSYKCRIEPTHILENLYSEWHYLNQHTSKFDWEDEASEVPQPG